MDFMHLFNIVIYKCTELETFQEAGTLFNCCTILFCKNEVFKDHLYPYFIAYPQFLASLVSCQDMNAM